MLATLPVRCQVLCLQRREAEAIRPPTSENRSVAQSGSAPRSGRGGRRFKSYHSDQLSHDIDAYGASYGERNPIPSLFGAANPNLLTLLTFRRPFVPRSTSPAGQRLPHVGLGEAELPGDLRWLSPSLKAAQTAFRQSPRSAACPASEPTRRPSCRVAPARQPRPRAGGRVLDRQVA
jgi:hypothetical protein